MLVFLSALNESHPVGGKSPLKTGSHNAGERVTAGVPLGSGVGGGWQGGWGGKGVVTDDFEGQRQE